MFDGKYFDDQKIKMLAIFEFQDVAYVFMSELKDPRSKAFKEAN